ncbi:class I SAM-dependent methyltransferase [Kribbella sindirgiensis]|uniref:class I SAM-dependent methyltransferase n=1 Tax=Kribbella sindirgiensis TaxID=1124744 RepID=UPI00192DEF72|nr:class I SAM-dependent methyltransferase [Kribbella sindirgiensis]
MTDRLARLAQSWDEAAEGYETYFVPRFAPWVRAAVDELDDVPEGPVLVPCCGTFPELALLAPRWPGRRIAGIDLSAGMVRLARLRAAGNPLVEVVQGNAMTLDPAWSAAAVVSVFGLQQLPDPATAIRSWYDVLRPGGRLCVVYWPGTIEDTGPFALLDKVIDAGRDNSWEDDLIPALDGAVIERDVHLSFPMTHPGAAEYFDAANHAGPMRALALARGDDYIAELRAKYLAEAPDGEWTHHPRARLISVRKQLSRAAGAPPTS